MDKMMWSKPEMNEFAFAANEYVASCGPGGMNWIFKCNANSNGWFSDGGTVYKESNGKDGLQMVNIPYVWPSDERMGMYKPCKEEHVASDLDEFFRGYLVSLGGDGNIVNKLDVIIWTGEKHDNIHCTTELDQNKWDRSPS